MAVSSKESEKHNISHSDVGKFLFTTPTGDSLKFFIRPSTTKAKLRPLIEAGGGITTSKNDGTSEYIKLAADNDIVTGQEYIQSSYIEDCIVQNKLLPLDDYRIDSFNSKAKPVPQVTSTADTTQSEPSPIRSVAKGRMKYTEEEDDLILQYVARHPSQYGGNKMWKKMELMKITEHSWQSMKCHFSKHLQSRLPEYVEIEEQRQPSINAMLAKFKEKKKRSVGMGEVGSQDCTEEKTVDLSGFLKSLKDPVCSSDQQDEGEESKDDDLSDEVNYASDKIQDWRNKYNLSLKAVSVALYVNSGDVTATEYLLQHKRLHPDTCLWTSKDDEMLRDSDLFQYNDLCGKYGLENVKMRQEFLLGTAVRDDDSSTSQEENSSSEMMDPT